LFINSKNRKKPTNRGLSAISKETTVRRLSKFVIRLIVTLGLVNTVLAQDNIPANDQRTHLTVTAFASGERVRFTAPSSVVQIRLEVYNSAGRKLLDNDVRGGNVFDWHLLDGQAEHVADGSYLCVVTAKSLSGRITQRLGTVMIESGAVSVRPTDPTQMTAQQTEVIGPVEENALLTILEEDQKQTTTVIAHNGEEGQITRGRGALSLRIGDFFSGKDTEQMRLTAEGNLGIGTSEPKLKLDVAGMIGAREGLMFSDGSTLSVNRKGVLTHTTASGDVAPSAAGTGTQDRLAKWTDNSGTLGDSGITETASGFLGIGTTAPQSGLDYRNGLAPFFTRDIGTTNFGGTQSALQLGVTNAGSRNAGVGPSFLFFADNSAGAKSFLGRVSAAWENPTAGAEAGSILFQVRANSGDTTASTERMRITASGNVGIGTAPFAFRLHVVDPSNAGLRVQTNTGGGTVASFGGNGDFQIDQVNVVGGRFTVKEAGNVGMGTASPQARLEVRGDIRLGPSGQYRATSGEENLRIIRGEIGTNGDIIVGTGFQVSHTQTGIYDIHFDTQFADSPSVTATLDYPATGPARWVFTVGVVAAGLRFITVDQDNNVTSKQFSFIAIGPR
jgi:hypothetical protein